MHEIKQRASVSLTSNVQFIMQRAVLLTRRKPRDDYLRVKVKIIKKRARWKAGMQSVPAVEEAFIIVRKHRNGPQKNGWCKILITFQI